MQNSVDISLADMQKKVREEVAEDREFLTSIDAKK
jgi:hypothetical protein